ncbi:unnamed protein product [Orchesella dallaii]|uniref:Uncharacterized protein n=1 Tax=Orchesella dallaii TaxID=48710 RepID=A0ABP1QVT6_9HEXA
MVTNVTTLSFNDTSCANLPPQFVNHVRSFKFTERLCVQFHDQPDCNGDSFQTTARVFTTSLMTWNFHNRTNSVRLCPDPCVPNYGQSIPIVANETNTSFPIIPISMFSAPDFKGRKLSITVQSCTHLDKNLGLVGLPISIRIPKTQCVLLFYTSVTQQTGDDRDCIVDDVGYSVLELQGSRPGLEYIPNWFGVIPAPYIKAISPCQCLSRMSYPDSTASVDFHPVENLITLFSSPNFRGQNVTILLNFTNCLTFTNDKFRDWEGTAESIYVGNKSCVSVYTEHDCPSNLETRIRSSIPYLFHYNLEQRIRSLRPCTQEESIVKNKSENTLLYFLIIVSCISTTIALGLIAIQMYIRKRFRTMYRTMKERLSEKEVKEFMEGLCLQLETVQDQDGQHFAIDDNGIGPVASKLSSDLLAQNQPYDNRLEIPVDQLEYGALI